MTFLENTIKNLQNWHHSWTNGKGGNSFGKRCPPYSGWVEGGGAVTGNWSIRKKKKGTVTVKDQEQYRGKGIEKEWINPAGKDSERKQAILLVLPSLWRVYQRSTSEAWR